MKKTSIKITFHALLVEDRSDVLSFFFFKIIFTKQKTFSSFEIFIKRDLFSLFVRKKYFSALQQQQAQS